MRDGDDLYNRKEIGKIDPKCWLCGVYTKPSGIGVLYKPLLCGGDVCDAR